KRMMGRAYKAPSYPANVFDAVAEEVVEPYLQTDGQPVRYKRLFLAVGKKLMHKMYAHRWESEAAEFNTAAEAPFGLSAGFISWQRERRFQAINQLGEPMEVAVGQTALDGTITVSGLEHVFDQAHVATSLTVYRPQAERMDVTYR